MTPVGVAWDQMLLAHVMEGISALPTLQGREESLRQEVDMGQSFLYDNEWWLFQVLDNFQLKHNFRIKTGMYKFKAK